MRKRTSKIWIGCDDVRFGEIIQLSKSYTDALSYFGLVNKGSNYRTMRSRISALGISTDHFLSSSDHLKLRNKETKSLDSILVEHSSCDRRVLKRRLISSGLLENNCSACGLGDSWNGKPITLQVDHINGISDDNRIENLRILCPNCHSQTQTFAGKRNKLMKLCECGKSISAKSNSCRCCSNHLLSMVRRENSLRPPESTLMQDIRCIGSYMGVGKKYGVSDNCIRKWVRSYGIDPKTINKKIS